MIGFLLLLVVLGIIAMICLTIAGVMLLGVIGAGRFVIEVVRGVRTSKV